MPCNTVLTSPIFSSNLIFSLLEGYKTVSFRYGYKSEMSFSFSMFQIRNAAEISGISYN